MSARWCDIEDDEDRKAIIEDRKAIIEDRKAITEVEDIEDTEGWSTVGKKKKSKKLLFKTYKIKCIKCNNDFLYSAKQQMKYHEKGWKEPKSCNGCLKPH